MAVYSNGYKHFELTNHLGNVMAVVTDIRMPVLDVTSQYIETFKPQLLIAKDYYPFGMEMSGRYSLTDPEILGRDYRYGFNGQEKDDEITGQTGSHLNYKYRMYDSRTGRFFAIDPLAREYPYNSTYAFSENRVIDCVELEGLERATANHMMQNAIWDGQRHAGFSDEQISLNQQKTGRIGLAVVSYVGIGAAIASGTALGISLGIVALPLTVTKHALLLSPNEKMNEKANKFETTVFGNLGRGFAKKFGWDEELAGSVGNLVEGSIFLGTMKSPETVVDVLSNFSAVINLGDKILDVAIEVNTTTQDNETIKEQSPQLLPTESQKYLDKDVKNQY